MIGCEDTQNVLKYTRYVCNALSVINVFFFLLHVWVINCKTVTLKRWRKKERKMIRQPFKSEMNWTEHIMSSYTQR